MLAGAVGWCGLAGCDPGWERPLPVEVPARSDEGALEIWTGVPCVGVTKIEYLFRAEGVEPITVGYRARRPQIVERWRFGSPPAGFRAIPLPPDVEWRSFEDLLIRMDGPGGQRSVTLDLTPIADEEAGSDYLVGREWLDQDAVLAGDGVDYALPCSPDLAAG